MIDAAQYRDGMALLGGAVTIVTTTGPAGFAGFTATAVCSVTDDPPTLLVCLKRSSFAHGTFVANQALCVSVLSADQRALADRFASRDLSLEEKFGEVGWTKLTTGSPAIDGALVNFDCRIVQTQDIGTHSVFFCEVDCLRLGGGGDGLVYFNRAYRRVDDSTRVP
jgi:flavin reductase